jgi:hypothetical protein
MRHRHPPLLRLALAALAVASWSSGCAGGDPVGDTPDKTSDRPLVTENANDGVAFHYFVGKGLTDVQAAGIVGNLDQESMMDPTIWEYGGGPGRGIAQWSADGRWDSDYHDNVVWYASNHGVNAWALQTQLDFIWYELTTFGYGFSKLKAANDVTSATLAFMSYYEMCGNCAADNRIAHANAALAAFGGGGDPGGGDAEAPAQIALDNVGNTACGENSLGGHGFGSSCTGNGGQPEYWCSDFVKWVWDAAGADVGGLTAAAGSFYCYGDKHGTLSDTPHVGDAVVFDYQGNCWADHVAIVTEVHDDGKIVTVSGDWNGKSGSQAYFASTASVVLNKPAYPGVVDSYAGPIGMTISGFISPVGIPAPKAKEPPPPPPEGSQAYVYPNQQHYLDGDGTGAIRHHYYDGNAKSVHSDTWGSGTVGQPVTFVAGTSQHVFARGKDGSLQHWFWDPANGANHDVWSANAGLAGDPTAMVIGDYEDVWAVDGGGKLQHWYWGPKSNGVQHDSWGSGVAGRPSAFVTKSGEQHVFARGTGGSLEHFWWTSSTGILHDTWGSGLAGDPTALAIGDFQDVWAVDGGGKLQHWYWGPKTNGVQHDTWGSGAAGRPSAFVTKSGEQHVFARGPKGTVEHWWWAAGNGIQHDTWGSGITGDPTALPIGGQQHVWALDSSAHAQHWYWDPATSQIAHDDWGH